MTLWWYDGGQPDPTARGGHDLSNKPPVELTADIVALLGEVPDSGCLLVGDGGTVFSPDDYGTSFFVKLKGEEIRPLHQASGDGAISGAHSAQPLRQKRQQVAFLPMRRNGSSPSRKTSRRCATRVLTSPRASRKSCCWAACRCARARKSSGTDRRWWRKIVLRRRRLSAAQDRSGWALS